MRKTLRLGLLAVAAATSLAFASSAFGAYAPKLSITRPTYPRSASQRAQRSSCGDTPPQPWSRTTAGKGPGPDGRVTVAEMFSGLSGVTLGYVMRVGPAQPMVSTATSTVRASALRIPGDHTASVPRPPVPRECGRIPPRRAAMPVHIIEYSDYL